MRNLIKIISEASILDIDDEEMTPTEIEERERERRIEAAVKQFCIKEVGIELRDSMSVMFDTHTNEISIYTLDAEITLVQLSKFAVMGKVRVCGLANYGLEINITVPQGFDISKG